MCVMLSVSYSFENYVSCWTLNECALTLSLVMMAHYRTELYKFVWVHHFTHIFHGTDQLRPQGGHVEDVISIGIVHLEVVL